MSGFLDDMAKAAGKLDSGINKGENLIDAAQNIDDIGDVSHVLSKTSSMLNTFGDVIPDKVKGNHGKGALQTNPSIFDGQTYSQDGKTYLSGDVPEGTVFIIPAVLSSTGEDRFIGKNAVSSILALDQKQDNAGNVVVLDEDNMPSQKVYDIINGDIYIKGTNQLARVNVDESVRLSEKEYEAIVFASKNKSNNPVYFKENKNRGQAEDATNDSPNFFKENWWKILLGVVGLAGVVWGGVELYNNYKEDKDNDASSSLDTLANTASTVSTAGNILSSITNFNTK